jgi:hypothetical protein
VPRAQRAALSARSGLSVPREARGPSGLSEGAHPSWCIHELAFQVIMREFGCSSGRAPNIVVPACLASQKTWAAQGTRAGLTELGEYPILEPDLSVARGASHCLASEGVCAIGPSTESCGSEAAAAARR